MARGTAEFSAPKLLEELAPLVLAESAPVPSELEAYRNFYGFTDGALHHAGLVDDGRHSLAVQVFRPENPRGTVVVCHGYYDHVGLYVYLIEYLLSRNLCVLAFDLPGHGLSSGDRATVESFDLYADALQTVVETVLPELPEPWSIAGQSLGGATVMEYLERQTARSFSNTVLFAPLIRPYAWAVNQWVFALAKLTIKERKRTITNNADNPEFIALQQVDPLQAHILPVSWVEALVRWMERFEKLPEREFAPCVIQGHADKTVEWRYNLGVLERRFQPRELHIAAGRHHLVNESPEIRATMWKWLDEQCGWAS